MNQKDAEIAQGLLRVRQPGNPFIVVEPGPTNSGGIQIKVTWDDGEVAVFTKLGDFRQRLTDRKYRKQNLFRDQLFNFYAGYPDEVVINSLGRTGREKLVTELLKLGSAVIEEVNRIRSRNKEDHHEGGDSVREERDRA